MKQCGRCGTQNLDQQATCTGCGLALPAGPPLGLGATVPLAPPGLGATLPLAPSGLGGTLLLPPPEGASPDPLALAETAPPAPHSSAAPPPPANFKGTMIGLAPPDLLPPAPVAPSPAPADAHQPSGAAASRNFSKTIIGMAPPSTPPAEESPEVASGGGRRLASAHKTVLGVARPGITPLNPGQAKSNPPPAGPVEAMPRWPAPAAAPSAVDAPPALASPPQRRISVAATLAIVIAAMLLVTAAMAFVMLRGRGAVSARATLDDKGREVLQVSCAECPDDTKTWIDGAPVSFRGGKALLPLLAPLKVGENPLLIVIERPGRSREEIALSIPIEFRVRGSIDELAHETPKVSVVASALSGTKLQVDGKPVHLDSSGVARVDYEVDRDVSGPEASVKTLERVVRYEARSADGAIQNGQVEIRIGITPLVVDAPGASIVVASAHVVIAGRTAPGSVLKIGSETVGLDPEGRFVSKRALTPGDNEFMLRATLKDHAPRLVRVVVRRVDNLDRELNLLRGKAQSSYADLVRAGDAAAGSSVALSGQLQDVRHDGYSSVLLVDVKKGCTKAPCLAKVVYGIETQLARGSELKAFGQLIRFVDGPRTGQRIPEIRAELVAAGAP